MIAPEYCQLRPVREPEILLTHKNASKCLKSGCVFLAGNCMKGLLISQDEPPIMKICQSRNPECLYYQGICQIMRRLGELQLADPDAKVSKANPLVPVPYFPQSRGACANFEIYKRGIVDISEFTGLQILT